MSRGVEGFLLTGVGLAIDATAIMLPGPWTPELLALGTSMAISGIEMLTMGPPTTPQTVKSPVSPWQIVYGNVRCGGTMIDCNSYGSDGNDFKYCDMIIVLAAHPTVGVIQHTETIEGDLALRMRTPYALGLRGQSRSRRGCGSVGIA